ncbi:MAG TPA: enoyl-CoA hydratase/isomerase family protein [Candidatus Binataceae bacterium]|nr:enoyl-CoA hydratase/isomerase family protein [Candidatus Binataceae bacterium]
MAETTIKVEQGAAWLTITLARPDKHNAINERMLEELDDTLMAAAAQPGLRALLLRAEGKSFCAGIDLNQAHVLESAAPGQRNLETVFQRLERFPLPTLAAINGTALAGGLELALHCDLRLAARGARLGMTLARVGIMLPFSFTRKLIEVCGAPGAARLLFTAEILDSGQAQAMGLVHHVVADQELEQSALAWLESVAANAPLSLRAMKASLRRAMSGAFQAPHDDIDRLIEQVQHSEDAREGPRAFLEKRKPNWQGR